jgi:hypothetical protein
MTLSRTSRPRQAGYGLPCAKCRRYFPADLDVCPICKGRERVPPNVAPLRRHLKAEAPAEPISNVASPELQREKLPNKITSPVAAAPAEVVIAPAPISEENLHSAEPELVVAPTLAADQVLPAPIPSTLSLEHKHEEGRQEITSPIIAAPAEVVIAPAPVSEENLPPAAPEFAVAPTLQIDQALAEPTPSLACSQLEPEEAQPEVTSPVVAVQQEQEEVSAPAPINEADVDPVEEEFAVVPALLMQDASEPLPSSTFLQFGPEEPRQEVNSPIMLEPELVDSTDPSSESEEEHHPAEVEPSAVLTLPTDQSPAAQICSSASQELEQGTQEPLKKKIDSPVLAVLAEVANAPDVPGGDEHHQPVEIEPAAVPTLATIQAPAQPLLIAPPMSPKQDEPVKEAKSENTVANEASQADPNSVSLNPATKTVYNAEFYIRQALKNRERARAPRFTYSPNASPAVIRPKEKENDAAVREETGRSKLVPIFPEMAGSNKGRQFDIATIVLGLVVLTCAVLMSVLVGLRLTGHHSTHPAHKVTSANAVSIGEQKMAPSNTSTAPFRLGAAGDSTADSLPLAGSSSMSGQKTRVSGAQSEGQATASAYAADSLRIQEDGKEAARSLPAAAADKRNAASR